MKQRANYFKIGLFVIGAGALLILGIIALGASALFQQQVLVETYFQESVQGLEVGSPVKFRGVQIGKVSEMTLVRKEYHTEKRYVLVRMALTPDTFRAKGEKVDRELFEKEVRQGLRVRLGFQGVTGAAYVEADYLDPQRNPPLPIDWTPKYPYIPSGPSIITRVTDAIDGILRNLEQIDVQQLTGSIQKALTVISSVMEGTNIKALGSQAEQLLAELRTTNRHLDKVVQDLQITPLIKDASATLASVRQLTEETRKPLQDMLAASKDAAENLNQVMGQVSSSHDLPASMAHLRHTLTLLDRLVTSEQQDLEETINNLRQMSENFKAVSETARSNPSQLFFGTPPPRLLPPEGK